MSLSTIASKLLIILNSLNKNFKLIELSKLTSNHDSDLDLDALTNLWTVSTSIVRQAIVKALIELISNLFNEATSDSESLLIITLDWTCNLLKYSCIQSPKDTYSRLCLFSQIRRLQGLATVLDESSGLLSVLSSILEYEQLSDFLLLVTIDFNAHMESHESELIQLSSVQLINQLLEKPMLRPKSQDNQYIINGVLNESSRILFIEQILVFLNLFRSHLKQNLKNEAKDETRFFLSSIRNKRAAPEIGTIEARTMWLLSLLNDSLGNKPFLPPSIVVRLNDLADEIASLDFPTLNPLCERLRQVLSNKPQVAGPTIPSYPDLIPKFIAKFTQERKDIASTSLTSKNSDFKNFGQSLVLPTELLASFEGIWVQIDADPDRLVLSATPSVQESVLDETHISCAPGILQVTQQSLIWWGLERESNLITAVYYPALTINHSQIVRFASGRVTDASYLPYASHTLHQMQKREDTATVRVHFLHVYTSETAFRFYPLLDEEVLPFMTLLKHVIGKDPFREMQLVKYLIAKRLEATRYKLFKQVLLHSHWIEHGSDLIKVIRKLTREGEHTGLFDMERLYHSCRVESEVTKETLYHLRMVWHSSQSEAVRLKVLGVMDRLLDPSVVHVSDANFHLMYKWLQHLEETVSPYKSAEALRIIMVLLSRCRAIQLDPLAPIFQVQANFDNLKDYEFFCSYFS